MIIGLLLLLFVIIPNSLLAKAEVVDIKVLKVLFNGLLRQFPFAKFIVISQNIKNVLN